MPPLHRSMDNVTHTLIGITLGHVCTLRRSRYRRLEIWTAMVASNLPDLDILLPQALSDGKLGYLLQHRGYSHALIFAIPLGLLAGLLIAKAAKLELRAWPQLLGVGASAAVLHLVADSWNEYGIHPFFPWGNRWFYGDFIFIL